MRVFEHFGVQCFSGSLMACKCILAIAGSVINRRGCPSYLPVEYRTQYVPDTFFCVSHIFCKIFVIDLVFLNIFIDAYLYCLRRLVYYLCHWTILFCCLLLLFLFVLFVSVIGINIIKRLNSW